MEDNKFDEQANQELDGFIQEAKPRPPRWRRFAFGFWILFLVVILVGVGGTLVYKTGFTFSQMNVKINNVLPLAEDEPTPQPDPDRINILLLGLRGEGDPDGGLLTDSIMVISYKKSTGQVALISIPRDLYVTMPGEQYKEKINFAYALGFEKRNGAAGGLLYSKIAISKVTGLNITYAISVDHAAFKEIVDILGGVDIYLAKPFIEDKQWTNGGDAGPSWAFSIQTETATTSEGVQTTQKWVFEIPAGNSHLDGNTALYFVRARYSSSDFDRVARQQQVLLVIKSKAFSLGVLANPVKLFQIMDSLGKNIRTDMTAADIGNLLTLYPKVDTKNVIHKVFDTTPEGLLYQTKIDNGPYILLPQGDNFDKIQEVCKTIFNR